MLLEGAWPPGEKLEALRIADEFSVSMTPVRDSLNLLAGARLVDLKPGEGYRVAQISEQGLRDMLDLNAAILDQCFPFKAPGKPPLKSRLVDRNYADRVCALFDMVAARAGNAILSETVRSLSERMHVVRNHESRIFPDALQELKDLERLAAAEDLGIRSRIRAYHEQRRDAASALIQLLY
ncbi:MAG: hypothetical protein A3J40_00055 [Erythrobacter sp. RIFCSPHIGHO2_12_FULL_63_10]|nr:MAG: hypothetical protein A3J40_00055 [Erythrobacter sp. RIFCSPHIGHO2_12_FULL_63_10]